MDLNSCLYVLALQQAGNLSRMYPGSHSMIAGAGSRPRPCCNHKLDQQKKADGFSLGFCIISVNKNWRPYWFLFYLISQFFIFISPKDLCVRLPWLQESFSSVARLMQEAEIPCPSPLQCSKNTFLSKHYHLQILFKQSRSSLSILLILL